MMVLNWDSYFLSFSSCVTGSHRHGFLKALKDSPARYPLMQITLQTLRLLFFAAICPCFFTCLPARTHYVCTPGSTFSCVAISLSLWWLFECGWCDMTLIERMVPYSAKFGPQSGGKVLFFFSFWLLGPFVMSQSVGLVFWIFTACLR